MGVYRKKPVEIEARRMEGGQGECIQVAEWMVENGYPWLVGDALNPKTLRYEDAQEGDPKPEKGIWIEPATGNLMIRTLEGDMRVSFGDWVIKGVQGEFYPCRADIFESTYNRVDECGELYPCAHRANNPEINHPIAAST